MKTNDKNCEVLKEELIKKVQQISCDNLANINLKNLSENINFKILNNSGNVTTMTLNNPVTNSDYIAAINLFHQKYDKMTGSFRAVFWVQKKAFNDVITENDGAEYMHVFFINAGNMMKKELDLLFLFSKVKKFQPNFSNVDSISNRAYLRTIDGELHEIKVSPEIISKYNSEFKQGIGRDLASVPNSMLTEYITDIMDNIKKFKSFEHDLYFELVCCMQGENSRLNLMTYVENQNRKHHSDVLKNKDIYGGYYDFGELRP